GAALAATALSHKMVTPSAPKTAITAEHLANAADEQYKAVHAMGLELKPAPMVNLATQIENDLTRGGFTPRNAKPVYEAVETLKTPPVGSVVTSHDFDNLRKEMVQ